MTTFDGGRESWEADLARREAEVCGRDTLEANADTAAMSGMQACGGSKNLQRGAMPLPSWRSLWLPLLPIALALGLFAGVAIVVGGW